MTSSSAVQQAVDLLSGRLAEAQQAHHELAAEIETITRALNDLRVYSTPDTTPSATVGAVDVPEPVIVPMQGKASVRSTVKAILDGRDYGFLPAEIRALIPEPVMEGKTPDQRRSTVRTALWSLRQQGEAVLLDGDRTISSKWVHMSQSPSVRAEGLSDDAQQENRGGDNDHDHPDDIHSQGHDHIN